MNESDTNNEANKSEASQNEKSNGFKKYLETLWADIVHQSATAKFWVELLALIGLVVYADITGCQLREMRIATEASRKAADTAAKALKSSDDSFKKTFAQMQAQTEHFNTLASEAKRQTDNFSDLVRATNKSVSVQTQVAKPIIFLNQVGVHHSEQDKKVWIIVRIQNNGTTEAKSISLAVNMDFRPPHEVNTANFQAFVDTTLPPFGPSQKVADSQNRELGKRISPEEYALYNNRRLYVRGKIRYYDAFGNLMPYFDFCTSVIGVFSAPSVIAADKCSE